MKNETVLKLLGKTGIPREPDFAVPINGVSKPLPYMVIRTKAAVDGDDHGRVRWGKTEWVVALFTTNRDDALESKVLGCLAPVGRVEVERFPDGKPYQTNFEFTTKQIMT